jgi:hypothetical protein
VRSGTPFPELLGGQRDGPGDWTSSEGVTYDSVLVALRDVSTASELRDLVEVIDDRARPQSLEQGEHSLK